MKPPRAFVWLPVLLVVLGVLAVSGGAWWYVQNKTAVAPTTTTISPGEGMNPNVSEQTSLPTRDSMVNYQGEQVRVLDAVTNPYDKNQALVVTVKSNIIQNTCGGLYDYGPCEFFIVSTNGGNAIRLKTLSMKPVSYTLGALHFISSQVAEFTASFGDAGAGAQSVWHINIENGVATQISKTSSYAQPNQ